MPVIPPITPASPSGTTQTHSPTSKLTVPIPIISNIATAIVNSTGKTLTSSKPGVSFPIRQSGSELLSWNKVINLRLY